MIVGSMTALSFSSKHSVTYNIDDIKERLLSKSSLATLTVVFALMTVCYILSYRIIKDITFISPYFSEKEAEECLLKRKEIVKDVEKYGIQQDDELDRIHNLEMAKAESMVNNPKWLKIPVFVFPWFAGFVSGMLALFAKCTIMLAVHIMKSDNSKSPFTYIIFLCTPIFIISELVTLNLGLKYFDTSLVIPIFKASIVFHNTMCGGVLLQEFFHYEAFHIWMYALGITVCIIGILIMLVTNDTNKAKQVKLIAEPVKPLLRKYTESTAVSEESP